jgi:outer membrane biosynthesis protein TonB
MNAKGFAQVTKGTEELFANYEVNRTGGRLPRLIVLGAASFALHALCVAAALYVPSVRDALNIASLFSGAEYVDEAYDKTAIFERAEVINVTDKFQYPAGYFYTPPPPTAAPSVERVIIKRDLPVAKPQPTPTPKPSPTPRPQPSPSPTIDMAKNVNTEKTTATAQANANQPLSPSEAEQQLNKTAAENHIKRPRTINKRPFVDLLAKYKQMKDAGQIDLSGTIEMTVEADRKPDGTLYNVVITQQKGDEKLKGAAKDFIAALSASGALDFLEGTDHLKMVAKLTETDVAVSVISEVESATRATQLASGYNGLLTVGALTRRGRDEEIIYKNTKATASGKQVTVNFNLPRATASTMLAKQLPAS